MWVKMYMISLHIDPTDQPSPSIAVNNYWTLSFKSGQGVIGY